MFRGGRFVRHNDLVMRKTLRFHSSAGPLNCSEASSFGPDRLANKISRVDDAEIAQQLALDGWRGNLAEERIQEIRALLIEFVRCLHIAKARHDFGLDSQIPGHEVQFVGNVLIGLDRFIDRGQSWLQSALMDVSLGKCPVHLGQSTPIRELLRIVNGLSRSDTA